MSAIHNEDEAVVTGIQAPATGGKRRRLSRDLCLFGILAGAMSVPLSPLVSSLLYREQRGMWFAFEQDQILSDAVKLDDIRMEPLGTGKVRVALNYTQLRRDTALNKTSLCVHVVPEDRANVTDQHRERGFIHLDFTPDPPLGSWNQTFHQEQVLSFPSLANQRATIRLATWNPKTKSGTAMYSYSFDFAEFDRGRDGAYADHIASPHKRNLAIYLATTFSLLTLIMILSRSRKPR
ncbi:MAG: hypothetical protein ACI89X_000831 [Planctomycetota bacterium]